MKRARKIERSKTRGGECARASTKLQERKMTRKSERESARAQESGRVRALARTQVSFVKIVFYLVR